MGSPLISINTEDALPESFHEIVEFGILASQTAPFDPMERALKELGTNALSGTEHIRDTWTLVREYPLTRKMLAMSRAWKSPESGNYIVATKGAPETIFDICHLDRERLRELSSQVNAMAKEGLRVIGIAKAYFSAN